MGILRSVPDKTINCSLEDFQKYYCVTASACGWQLFMQDFHFSFKYSEQIHVMGILDGQGGPQVAQFCHNQIPSIIKNCDLMKLEQYQAAIQNLCFTLDERIKYNHNQINEIRQSHNLPKLPTNQQTPASASIIICIIDGESVTIGNLGECKSYVSYKNSEQTFILISGNHMIEKDEDADTINKKGGFIVDGLINGKFLHTRTIGNLKYKNLNDESKSLISSQPSVFTLRLQDLNAIVLGSSGLWQRPELVLKQIFDKKLSPLEQKENVRHLVENLISQNLDEQFGRQNISVKVLTFNHKHLKSK